MFRKLFRRLLSQGYYLYHTDQGEQDEFDACAILHTTSPDVVLKTMDTSGPNHDLGTDDVIAQLKAWNRAYGVTLYSAGSETIVIQFTRTPTDAGPVVEEIGKMAPSEIENGDDGDLASQVSSGQPLFIWLR